MSDLLGSSFWKQAYEVKKQAVEQAKKLADQANDLTQQLNDQLNADEHFSALLGRAPTPGDPNWVKAVQALDLTYITERVISMGMPYDIRAEMIAQAKETMGGEFVRKKGPEKKGNNIDVIAALLNHRHAGHYMVWNVSEDKYDYSKFSNQVLDFEFPGHPAPPLGLLFKICTSIENWLSADSMNVALMHCLTGKGRTATILSCYLCWSGEFSSVMEALQFISQKKGMTVELLTIPSQRRYLQYFSNMLDGVKPRSEPLLLRRIIMNTIPKFGMPLQDDVASGSQDYGCCPYIQLFKGGKLIFTTAWASGESGYSKPEDGVAWAYPSEESVAFNVDMAMQGDMLLRCRHLTAKGSRVSMFRAAFHTGYVPCGVLRFNKAQLDGACADARFDDNFFLDLMFAPVTKATSSTSPGDPSSRKTCDAAALNSAAHRRERGLELKPDSCDSYDAMLHRDARFWEEIVARKERAKERQNMARAKRENELSGNTSSKFSISELGVDDDETHDDGPGTAGNSRSAVSLLGTGGVDCSEMNSIRDADLFEQLASLGVGDDDEEEVVSSSVVHQDKDTLSSRDEQSRDSVADSIALCKAALEKSEKHESVTSATSSSGGALAELEELEHELGLSSTQKNSEVIVDLDDGDLDDFEGYLNSLNSPSK